MFCFLFFLWATAGHAWPTRDASCDGASVRLAVTKSGGLLWGLSSEIGSPLTRSPTPPLTLRVATPLDGCHPPAEPYTPTNLVLVSRGGCSFLDKAAAARGAAAVAVVADDAHCFAAGVPANATKTQLKAAVTTITVDGATGARLFAASGVANATVTLSDVAAGVPRADPAAAVISLLATACVAVGALFAGRDEVGGGGGDGLLHDAASDDATPPRPTLSLDTPAAAGALILGAAILLIASAMLPAVARFALTTLFLIGSAEAAAAAITTAAAPHFPPSTASHAGVAAAAAAVAAWLVLGPRVGWPLHDALACCLLTTLIRALRVPSLKVATALLALAAANDAWWVYLQPRLIPHSQSIMVKVASSTPALVLLAPGFTGGPHAPFALLGFGDVAIPGLAVAAAARWDAVKGQAPTTAGAAVGGYIVGLCLTYAALLAGVGGGPGQPALVYICPAVLAAIGVAAAAKRQAKAMWAGLDGAGEGEEVGANL